MPLIHPQAPLEGLAVLWNRFYYDHETGNYYLRNRYYSPLERRFLTDDPDGINPDGNWNNLFSVLNQFADGFGLRVYANGDPVNRQDLWGLTPTQFWICYRMTQTKIQLPIHAYLFYGDTPWGIPEKGEGWGFSGGDVASSEQYFRPSKCRKCSKSENKLRKINYGPAKGRRCPCANDAEIWGCVKAYPPRRKYSLPDYTCLHYAEEAKQECCLNCSITSIASP